MGLHNYQTEQTVASIEDAIVQEKWQEAIKKCQRAFIAFKEQTPLEVFVFMSMACRNQGTLHAAARIIDQAQKNFPDHPAISMEQKELSGAAQGWKTTEHYLRILQKTFISQGKKITRARMDCLNDASHQSLIANMTANAFESEDPEALQAYHRVMHDAVDREDILATQAYKMLLREKFSQAHALFSSLLDMLAFPPSVKENWIAAFGELINLTACLRHDCKNQSRVDASILLNSQKSSNLRKVISSGMGWSGSGAVTAYLREFHDVDYVHTSELCHLDGPYSISKLLDFHGSTQEYINFMISFFAFTLFGFGASEDSDGRYDLERSKLKTRKLLHHIPYIQGVTMFIKYAGLMLGNSKSIDSKKIKIAANIILDAICLSCSSSSSSTVLLDNVLHIQDLKIADLLDDTWVVCVYRDPRSNYVALVEEDWKRGRTIHDKGASAYCNFYSRTRKKAELALDSLGYNRNKVQSVQFERFVAFESYRNELALSLGLNPQKRDKYRYFKPHESINNIDNYIRYRNQAEIELIESLLPVYLYPLTECKI